MTADDVIEQLGLTPHPREGGFFRETYRSEASFRPGAPYVSERALGTAIYYLLTPDTYSALHRLPGDEVFHFYLGDPVEMLELMVDGSWRTTVLGAGIVDMRPQHVVPGGTWQGSRLRPGGSWALLGTTMAPGFSYDDYEEGDVAVAAAYPEVEALARTLLPPDASE